MDRFKGGRTTKQSFLACLLIASMSIVGCGGPYAAPTVRGVPVEIREKVIYKNFWLQASVALLRVDSETKDGFLRAKAQFKNAISSSVNAEIKVKFYDSKGYEIADNAGWEPFPIESQDIKSFERIAPTKAAVEFKIFLKLASDPD